MTCIDQTLAALGNMTAAQLREQYLQVFGEPARTSNKTFLYPRVAWRIQSLAEGGLSERAKRRAEELARDADLRTSMPRPPKDAEEAVITRSVPCRSARKDAHARLPIAGTVLTRQYRRRHIEVKVLADGTFEYERAYGPASLPVPEMDEPPRSRLIRVVLLLQSHNALVIVRVCGDLA